MTTEGERSASAVDVVGVGAVCLDIVSRVPAPPEEAGARAKVRVMQRVSRCGGQAATTLSACARLGLRTAFVGCIGDDAAGSLVRDVLRAKGVDVSQVIVQQAATATALIVVPESTGERMVLWHREAALSLDPARLPVELLRRSRVVHVDDVDLPLAVAAARVARRAGALVTTDIDQTNPAVLDLVAEATHVIFADQVPQALTGETTSAAALAALGRRYRGTVFAVTLGAEGALLWQSGAFSRVEGHVVSAADTTGAGDIFRAGFIYGLCHDWPLEKVLRFANAAAACSCTREGGIDGAPTLDEINEQLGASTAPRSGA